MTSQLMSSRLINISHRLFRCRYSNSRGYVASSPSFSRPATRALHRACWQAICTQACLVPRPHYYARPMRFGSRGPRKFLRPRQTRRSETFCLTWGGAFGSGQAVNNISALMKDVQQPSMHFYSMHVFIVESPLAFLFHLSH